MFAISVELLFGTYRGDPDGTANTGPQALGEWPPAPSRLLSALVAADGTGDACHVTRVTDGRELSWFEELPAPRIHADARANHQPLHTRYVVKHASGQGIGTSGRAKWAQKEYVARAAVPVRQGARVSVRDPRVVYCWDVEPPPAEILASLRRRAARVGYLGAADSPVRLRVGEEFEGPLPVVWEPDESGDVALGVPQAGDVGVLDRMYGQWRKRGASVARLQFPALHREARYRSPGFAGRQRCGGEVVAWLRLAESVPGRRIGAVTGLFKAATLRLHQQVHGDVPQVLHGHGFASQGYEIARFLALPDVGRVGATGRIGGLALWMPAADGEVHRRAREAAFGLRRLVGRGLDVGVVAGEGGEGLGVVGPQAWVGPSRGWATAVPAIHERRRRLDLDELGRWSEHAGLPRPVAFRERRSPFVAGGLDLAPVEVNRPGRPGLPYSHVELWFEKVVDGPVVIGSGRQRAFGLCIPLDGRDVPSEGRHSADAPVGRAPSARQRADLPIRLAEDAPIGAGRGAPFGRVGRMPSLRRNPAIDTPQVRWFPAAAAKAVLILDRPDGVDAVGEIVVECEVENTVDRTNVNHGLVPEARVRRASIEGVVDTGAVMLMLPQNLVERLGLETCQTVIVTDADERKEERLVAGPVTVRIGDRITQTQCVIGPPLSEPLIGQLVLEAVDMVADCTNRTLTPRTPDYPLLKMK